MMTTPALQLVRSLMWRVLSAPPSYAVFFVLLLLLYGTRPEMFNSNVLGVFLRQVVPLGIVVLGQLLVMSVRSIDLSVGGVILLVNYVISAGVLSGLPLPLAIALCLMTGMAVGLVNGLLVARRRASAVIVTLAVGLILTGIVEYMASGRPPGSVSADLRALYNTRFFGVPGPVILWLLLSLISAVALSRLVFGRYVTAVGENPVAARIAGVPVERTILVAHAISGLMAGLAGVVQTASIAVGSLRFGPELALNSIAATILGGVIFGRGSGGVWGPVFGVAAFALLFALLMIYGVQQPGKLIIQGGIIALAAIIYGLKRR